MRELVACPGCNRHLRRSETQCPFCTEPVAAFLSSAPSRVMPTERLSRALLLTFAASMGTVACGGETDDGTGRSSIDGGGDAAGLGAGGDDGAGGDLGGPEYGAPPPPATGGKPSGAGGSGAGGGGVGPVYGLPPAP